MTLRLIGEPPFARDAQGRLKSRIAVVFPLDEVLVTLPGIHATQRLAYLDVLNAERRESKLPPLTRQEEAAICDQSVDLVMVDDRMLIRPNPSRMDLAFHADESLQTLMPKSKIRFLFLWNEQVRMAIKRRGENWRISPLPRSPEELNHLVVSSRTAISGNEIYYYSQITGARLLTYQEFVRLGELDDVQLRLHLREVQQYATRVNRAGENEITFFMADKRFGGSDFAEHDFEAQPAEELRATFADLRQRFRAAVRPEYREDNLQNLGWRNHMVTALLGRDENVAPDEIILGLASEFFMQVQWLPGGRIEDGELIFDSICNDPRDCSPESQVARLYDAKCRGFIFNYVREFGDLEYINVGRVANSLSQRRAGPGRREVYIAELKQRGSPKEIIRILRMQKWGVREHLEEGKSLLDAMLESEDYTEFVLDRRLGCRQLGMNLTLCTAARRIGERYYGNRPEFHGQCISSPYFERDYIAGCATDKLPPHKLKNDEYALKLFRLLGQAAAPNMIVGRADSAGGMVFDDGDEVVIEDENQLPQEIIVSDHTSTFLDYRADLLRFAPGYARPINMRLGQLNYPEECAELYIEAFVVRFMRIQEEYLKRKRAFDLLFDHRRRDEAGSFAFRWERVLERLAASDPVAIGRAIREHIRLGQAAVPVTT